MAVPHPRAAAPCVPAAFRTSLQAWARPVHLSAALLPRWGLFPRLALGCPLVLQGQAQPGLPAPAPHQAPPLTQGLPWAVPQVLLPALWPF